MRHILKNLISTALILSLVLSLSGCLLKDPETLPFTIGISDEKPSRDRVLTIGNHVLGAAELNYFYIDAISTYCNQYSYYISYIIDTKSPLNSESNTDTNGATWADKFLDMAIENIESTYQLYDLAVEDGFQLSEDEKAGIDDAMLTLEEYAAAYGFANTNAYLRDRYGKGADLDSYRKYYEICTIAQAYYNAYSDSLVYDHEDLQKYEAGKEEQYNAYSFAYYYVRCSAFLTGGTKDSNGNVVYSDDEKTAAVNKARAVAEQLIGDTYRNNAAFDDAIYDLLSGYGIPAATLVSEKRERILYSDVNALFIDWLCGTEDGNDDPVIRQNGDMTIIASESGSGNNKTINGFFVLRFGSVQPNNFTMKNVRHLLVKFQGGTTGSAGNISYSDAEKQAAKLNAVKLLEQFERDGATEELFIQMANQYSDDGDGTTGGLYENIYPGQMVEPFEDWCYASSRKSGDYGLVETMYGYHLMYFVGESDMTYRNYMIEQDLRMEELANWHNALVDAANLKLLTSEYVNLELILDSFLNSKES